MSLDSDGKSPDCRIIRRLLISPMGYLHKINKGKKKKNEEKKEEEKYKSINSIFGKYHWQVYKLPYPTISLLLLAIGFIEKTPRLIDIQMRWLFAGSCGYAEDPQQIHSRTHSATD